MALSTLQLLQHNTINDVICMGSVIILIRYLVSVLGQIFIAKSYTTVEEGTRLLEYNFVFSHQRNIILYF